MYMYRYTRQTLTIQHHSESLVAKALVARVARTAALKTLLEFLAALWALRIEGQHEAETARVLNVLWPAALFINCARTKHCN